MLEHITKPESGSAAGPRRRIVFVEAEPSSQDRLARQEVSAPARRAESRLPFAILCAYLLAQSFMVPILPFGPWAAWPNLADLVFYTMPLAMLLSPKSFRARTGAHHTAFAALVGFFAACAASYTVLVVLYPELHPGLTGKSVQWGGFELYRLFQFLVIFWYVSGLEISERQWPWISRVLLIDFFVIALGAIGSHTGVIPTSFWGSHLPTDTGRAGPWAYYALGVVRTKGGGTMSYNHVYPALQLLLVSGGLFHFSTLRRSWFTGLILLAGAAGSVATGSRTGLVAFVLLAGLILLRNASGLVVAVAVTLAVVVLAFSTGIVGAGPVQDALNRTGTIGSSYSSDSFSGRGDIWQDRLDFLNEEPARWLFGGGFGSAIESGSQAHNHLLQVVIETGLFGLLVQVCLFATIIRLVALRTGSTSVLIYLHLALAVACVAQEVFYPLPKLGHFLGLYFTLVALGLKIRAKSAPAVRGSPA